MPLHHGQILRPVPPHMGQCLRPAPAQAAHVSVRSECGTAILISLLSKPTGGSTFIFCGSTAAPESSTGPPRYGCVSRDTERSSYSVSRFTTYAVNPVMAP